MTWLATISQFFSPQDDQRLARELYIALVAQSRKEFFYTDLDVPDSLDGRFDMITLHMFLLVDRLQQEKTTPNLIRLLSETLFSDMDRSLRELGVGDTGVARRIQKMASGFYGRIAAYGSATDDTMLTDALLRNAYGTVEEPPRAKAQLLANYVRNNQKTLSGTSFEELQKGSVLWNDSTIA